MDASNYGALPVAGQIEVDLTNGNLKCTMVFS